MNLSEDTKKNLGVLKRKMSLEVKPILFTGAGFSFGAKNKAGKPIPLGEGLKQMLISDILGYPDDSEEYKDFVNASLMEIYSLAEDQNQLQTRNFITDLFSEVIPLDYHRAVLDFPWQKIYTVNIDDLVENVFNINSKVSLNSLNSTKPKGNTNNNKLDYIKLHGCVRNHDGGFVFSSASYMNKIEGLQDYRYSRLVEDMQTQDFVFIGTTGDEPDIYSYLLKFGVDGNSKRGNVYVVVPNPGAILRLNARNSGAHLISMTTEQFSEWIKANFKTKVPVSEAVRSQRWKRNFRDVRDFVKIHTNDDNTDTRLYMGDHPSWLDIINDYDFKTPSSDKIFRDILNQIENSNENLVVTILGKAIGGKSVHLKRIGLQFLKNGYDVFEFTGLRFNIYDIMRMAKGLQNDTIVLLVEDASGYYSLINRLIEGFPVNKRLIVVATSRPYFHYKKYYELIHFNGFYSVDIDKALNANYFSEVGKSAYETLKGKGLLGKWRNRTQEEFAKEFVKRKDITEVLGNIFDGAELKSRYTETYESIKIVLKSIGDKNQRKLAKDFLIGLALFSKVDLPYLPNALTTIWLRAHRRRIEQRLGDILKVMEPDGVALRTNYFVQLIIDDAGTERLLDVTETILKSIAPFIEGDRSSYWHQIQSRLMNESFLHRRLRIKPKEVRGLFTKLLYYYPEDANYFLQLGRVEQTLGQYEVALNHFQQAETIAPNYYNIRNAKARNYLLWSYKGVGITKNSARNYYSQGYKEMLDLIEEKEQYQVRAYSVHSLAVESVSYWRKWNLTPDKEEIVPILYKLNDALSDFENDGRIEHACKKLYIFMKERNITKWIPGEDDFPLQMCRLAMSKKPEVDYSDDDLD